MELEELKDLWNESNRKLEASSRLDTPLVGQRNLRRADTSLKQLARGITAELIVNLIGIVLLGAFAADHAREPRFFIPAAVLDVYAIALVCRSAAALRTAQPGLRRTRRRDPGSSPARSACAHSGGDVDAALAPLMWLPLLIALLR
jgi:hypothetical protein